MSFDTKVYENQTKISKKNMSPIYKKLAEQTFPKLNSPPKQDNHFNLVRKRGRIETSPDSLRPQKTGSMLMAMWSVLI